MNNRPMFWLFIAAGLMALIAVYANHFNNGFHLDDETAIVDNEQIRELRNTPSFFSGSPPALHNEGYRPLLALSLAVDYALAGGLSVFTYHLQSFFWFCLLLVLMLILYRALLRQTLNNGEADFWAILCVLLFAFHPATAETVNHILRRGEILATCGVVGGLVVYSAFPTARRWGLYLVPVLLGLFSDLSAVMFAPILFSYILLIERDHGSTRLAGPERRREALSAALAATPGAALGLSFAGLHYLMAPTAFSTSGLSPYHYAVSQPFVILHYFKTLFLPTHLSADANWPAFEGVASAKALLGFAFLVLLVGLAWRLTRDRWSRGIAFGLWWFLLALLPTSSFLPHPEVMSYPRTFFPYVGLLFGAVIGLRDLVSRRIVPHPKTKRALALVLLVLVLPAFAYGSFVRNQVWNSEESLWGDVVRKDPSNGRGLMNYGRAFMSNGDAAKGLEYFQRAAELLPRSHLLQINLGLAKEALGRTREADSNFRQAFDYKPPRDPLPAFYYGRFLFQHGQYTVAFSVIQEALERDEFFLPLRILALQMLARIGSWQEVRTIAEATLAQAPSSSEARAFLDLALADGAGYQEDFAQIRDHARQACAVEDFLFCTLFSQRALLLNPESAEILGNLCFASWRSGNTVEAELACDQAIALDPDLEFIQQDLHAIRKAIQKSKN